MTVVATVYDRTNTTWICDLVVEDDGVQQAPTAAKGQEQLNRANDCSVTVAATHPNVGELQHLRVVRVSDGDVSLPPFTIRSIRTVEVGEQQLVTVSGPSLLDRFGSVLMRGVVPDVDVEPQSNRRVWNYSTPTLPTTDWTDDPHTQLRESSLSQTPVAWPDSFAAWVWHVVEGGTHPTDSWTYFRREFTLDSPTTVVFYWSADDYGDISVDGVQLESERQEFPSDVWQYTWHTKTVRLPAGDHVFAGRAYNDAGVGAFRASALEVNGFDLGDPIFTTGEEGVSAAIGDWLVLGDPTIAPGCTVGQIVREAVEDAQADGCLTGWTLGFTDTLDSNGDAWPVIGEFGIEIDAYLSELLDKLTPFADFATADNGLELLAYDKATGRGQASGKTFTAGENLLSLVRTVEV